MNIEGGWIGELPNPLRTAMLWGWQTILYAMSKRAADLGVDMMAQQRAAGEEGLRILRDMFERARKEAKDPWEMDGLITGVARQVVDWVVEHVGE